MARTRIEVYVNVFCVLRIAWHKECSRRLFTKKSAGSRRENCSMQIVKELRVSSKNILQPGHNIV